MKKEFEEQQKNSILSGGAAGANPLQNFDMAAWMAGKTTGMAARDQADAGPTQTAAGHKGKRRG